MEFTKVALDGNFPAQAFHAAMQKERETNGRDLTLKTALTEVWGSEMTPQKFYHELGIDVSKATVNNYI